MPIGQPSIYLNNNNRKNPAQRPCNRLFLKDLAGTDPAHHLYFCVNRSKIDQLSVQMTPAQTTAPTVTRPAAPRYTPG